jgi:outer membrane lipoprotein-sorting protein
VARVSSRIVACCCALVACTILFGCQPARVRPQLPATLPSAEGLLATLARRRAAIATVRGFARISYESAGKTVGSRHAVVVEGPARLRLEVLGPLGAIAVIASDGRELALYVRRENTVYRGTASAESIAAYAAVPMSVEDIVTVLLGSPPERTPTAVATVTTDADKQLLLLTVPVAAGRQRIWLAPRTLAPVAAETPIAGGSMLRVDFGDLRPIDGVTFPFSIDVRTLPGDRAIHVRYTTPALDAKIAPELFAIPARAGVEERAIAAYSPEVAAP